MTANTDYQPTLYDKFRAITGALRWTAHTYRLRHDRYQTRALASLEEADFRHREHQRLETVNPTAAGMEQVTELFAITSAITNLEECGCPPFVWDTPVLAHLADIRAELRDIVDGEEE